MKMAGEKRFRNSFIGFNKGDVAAYMEKIIKEYGEQIRLRDEEIANLKAKRSELERKCIKLQEKMESQTDDKELIAKVLLKAQEKADDILKKAEEEAEIQKMKLEAELEGDREKIVEAKGELKELRKQAMDTMKNFSTKLQGIVEYNEAG
jgi:cell division septum initiation protein DivIVA